MMTGMEPMYCLSLDQPWAELIALGIKPLETRWWRTHIRGRIAIASTHRIDLPTSHKYGLIPPLPLGVLRCTVELVGCRVCTHADEKAACAPVSRFVLGTEQFKFGFELVSVELLHAVPVKGKQKFWRIDPVVVNEARIMYIESIAFARRGSRK